jgi:hypothetical protein
MRAQGIGPKVSTVTKTSFYCYVSFTSVLLHLYIYFRSAAVKIRDPARHVLVQFPLPYIATAQQCIRTRTGLHRPDGTFVIHEHHRVIVPGHFTLGRGSPPEE